MFTEDLSAMFDDVYGFAVSAVYKGVTIKLIYDDAYFLVPGEDVGIDSTKPAAICQATDVSGVKQGDSITVDGINYTVNSPKPDGPGQTIVLALEKA